MSEWLRIAASLFAGALLGIFYFGGLWLTVQWLPKVRHPAVLALISYLVRLVVALIGFYLLMNGRWQQLVACLAGFLVARLFLTRSLGLRQQSDLSR